MMRTMMLMMLVAPVACGGGGGEKAESDKKRGKPIEGALSHVFEGQEKLKAQDEGIDKLKEKAEEEAKKAREEMYAKAVALPAQMPKSLDVACAQASEAYDKFMQSKLQGTALEKWNSTKQVDLEKGLEHCKQLGSIEVAACQGHALTNPPPTATDEGGRDLMLRCESKFGPEKEGEGKGKK